MSACGAANPTTFRSLSTVFPDLAVGYDVVECAGLDAAIGVAAGHPLARTAKVEVRPFWDAPWDH
jgi:hypothetical protein